MKNIFHYTKNVPLFGKNVINIFVFETKQGNVTHDVKGLEKITKEKQKEKEKTNTIIPTPTPTHSNTHTQK